MSALIRRPAFWLWLLLCLGGLVLLVLTMLPQVVTFPAGAAVGIMLLTPVLICGFLLFRWLHPVRSRPWSYALIAACWGLTAAFGVAFLANTAFLGVIAKTAGLTFGDRWGAAVAAPIDEETAKLAGVVLLALMAPRAIRSPLDGFGYGALVGIGFQMVENFLYVFNTIVLTGAVHSANAAVGSFVVRVAFGAWWSHWTFTCVSGAGLGYLLGSTDRPLGARVGVGVAGWGAAVLMHCWFNSPLLELTPLMLIVRGAPLLLIAVLVYRWVRARYLVLFREAARREIALGVLQPGEEEFLVRRSRRRSERRALRYGETRGLAQKLRTTQLALIDEDLAGTERTPLNTERLRYDVSNLRALLEDSLARHNMQWTLPPGPPGPSGPPSGPWPPGHSPWQPHPTPWQPHPQYQPQPQPQPQPRPEAEPRPNTPFPPPV